MNELPDNAPNINQEQYASPQSEAPSQAEVNIDGKTYNKTVLPAFTREDAVKTDRSLSLTGRLGDKPSSSLGSQVVEQTQSVMDSNTGKIVSEKTISTRVSSGAKRPGVPGDIQSRNSGL
jgi:hypothetical protein